MAYNMTSYTGSFNVLQMFSAINESTNNLLIYFTIIGVWVVLFVSLNRNNNSTAESIAASSGVTSVFILLMMMAGLVNAHWLIGSTILFGVAGVSLYLKKSGG